MSFKGSSDQIGKLQDLLRTNANLIKEQIDEVYDNYSELSVFTAKSEGKDMSLAGALANLNEAEDSINEACDKHPPVDPFTASTPTASASTLSGAYYRARNVVAKFGKVKKTQTDLAKIEMLVMMASTKYQIAPTLTAWRTSEGKGKLSATKRKPLGLEHWPALKKK